jgi:antitoxin (DNA-binding transcriptional repressor) of toxin-antitoxin stability system
MFNMENKDYKKINLRNFRHNLTQVKDSLSSGEMYEVLEKGNPVGYFIPAHFDIAVSKKKSTSKQELKKAILSLSKGIEFKDEVKECKDYKEAYRKLLEKKYLGK